MSAEVLREAAQLMRERADDATAGTGASDWFVAGVAAAAGTKVRSSGGTVASTSRFEAEHIASWHPDVALAVADWLAACALVTEVAPDRERFLALRVARAYLGTNHHTTTKEPTP